MSNQGPLKRFKFTYQTEFSSDHDYKKIIYASTSKIAWVKFNNYCQERNITLHAAYVDLSE